MVLIDIKHIYLTGVILLLLTSCVTQKYQQPSVPLEAQLYRDTTIVDSLSIATLPYTQLFADTVLQNLITEGIRENYDLKTAVQRINEAQASVYQSTRAFLPGLDGNLRVIQNKQSVAALNLPPSYVGTFPLTVTTVQASVTTSWEADIRGKFSSAKKTAIASLLQTEAAKRAVQTQLIANIANWYYQLLALDQQLKITEQTLQNRIDDVKTMKTLKESAIVTGAAVVQSEANRYAAEVSIPDIKLSIRETENALSTLLARAPGSVKRATLTEQVPYETLQVGIPSQLLKNRPDIQQAEFGFRAAFENTNLARTYFYPQLTLTGELGASTLKIKNLFNRSIFYNIIGGLTQPVFSKGQNKARLRTALAQQEQAYYAYQQSMLTAGQEVSNALYKYQTALEKQGSRNNQLQALDKSVSFTKQLLRYSSATNYTDVLTSEQALLAAQLSAINDRLQQMQAVVDLYKALGGGWQ